MKDEVLILTSVASMVDQFLLPNIQLLLQLNYKVHVACNFEKGNTCSESTVTDLKTLLLDLRVEYHQIDFERDIMQISSNIRAYSQIKTLTKSHNFIFIHCHSPIGGLCGRLIGHKTKTSVIYTAHGFHFYKGASILNWIIFFPVERMLARLTDTLITINKEDYCRAKKFHANEIKYIPGVGVNLQKFKHTRANRLNSRNLIGVSTDEFLILSIGELNKNKNHKVIIEAIAELRNYKIKYIICGKGPLENKLKQLCHKLNLENQVVFMGFQENISDICRASDLFVFPSFREGLSLALMEAMASGLPVVCSDIRGNSDLIKHGKGGFLVAPKDVLAISESIKEIITDTEMRESFAKYNIDVVKDFSEKEVTKKMMSIYNGR